VTTVAWRRHRRRPYHPLIRWLWLLPIFPVLLPLFLLRLPLIELSQTARVGRSSTMMTQVFPPISTTTSTSRYRGSRMKSQSQFFHHCYCHCQVVDWPQIIYINGPSSSGKTTLRKGLQCKLKNEGYTSGALQIK